MANHFQYNNCFLNSHRTAIKRNKPSAPLKNLISKGLIRLDMKILDYGCGKGDDVEALKNIGYRVQGYDPYWYNNKKALYANQKYDIILITYVFCVLDKSARDIILEKVATHLKKDGKIYVSVRRDIKHDFTTKNGTNQYAVYLNQPIIEENSSFCIYEIKH